MNGERVPNLRGASLVGHDRGGRSYAARTDSRRSRVGVVVVAGTNVGWEGEMLLTEGRTLWQSAWAGAVPCVELGADKGVYPAECSAGLTRRGLGLTRRGLGLRVGWYQIGEGSHPRERGGVHRGGVAVSPPGRLGEELKPQQDDVSMTRGVEEGIRDRVLGRGVSMSEGSGVTRRCVTGGPWVVVRSGLEMDVWRRGIGGRWIWREAG